MHTYENTYFTIEHSTECAISGYLIVRSKHEVASVAELSLEAQRNLGEILAISQKIIQDIVKPERIYILSFGEMLPKLHFHLFPRTKKMLDDYNQELQQNNLFANGAMMFDWARKKYQHPQNKDLVIVEQINLAFHQIKSL